MRRRGDRLDGVAGWVWIGVLAMILLAHPGCENAPVVSSGGNAVTAVPIPTASAITMDSTRESASLATPILLSKLQEPTRTPSAASPAGVTVASTVSPTAVQADTVPAIDTALPLHTPSTESNSSSVVPAITTMSPQHLLNLRQRMTSPRQLQPCCRPRLRPHWRRLRACMQCQRRRRPDRFRDRRRQHLLQALLRS